MEIRKAGVGDIDALLENRLELVGLLRTIENREEYSRSTRAFMLAHLEDDTVPTYIAVEGGMIVASCMLCIYETLPVSRVSGKTGLLLNMYTIEGYRRKGLATRLLEETIREARRLGVVRIRLDYTDDGYNLYKKMGFRELDREMALDIDI